MSADVDAAFSKEKWVTVIAYMLSMGVCGVVLVALGSTLEDLANQIGFETTSIGTVFIARGAGSILGAIVCSKLYRWFSGNIVMSVSLMGIIIILVLMPSTRTITELHIFFFSLGLGTAVVDTGCQLMTRKLHGEKAGPWLGANATVFGLSAALVPILESFSSKLTTQYFTLATLVGLTCCLMLCASRYSNKGELHPTVLGTSNSDDNNEEEPHLVVPHYYAEIIISIMLFCFVGGSIAATAYLKPYIDQTAAVSIDQKGNMVFVLWVSITIGRIVGVQDQRSLTTSALARHMTYLCLGGFCAMLLVLIFPRQPSALWIGVASYGFFHGPTVGFCQDLNNRLTFPSEKSMAIVMFGLNCGASFVPYFTTLLWDADGSGPMSLILIMGLSMLIPLPLLYAAECVSYVNTQHQQHIIHYSYGSVHHQKRDTNNFVEYRLNV